MCMHVLCVCVCVWLISVTALFAHPGSRCCVALFALLQNIFIEEVLKLYSFKANIILDSL